MIDPQHWPNAKRFLSPLLVWGALASALGVTVALAQDTSRDPARQSMAPQPTTPVNPNQSGLMDEESGGAAPNLDRDLSTVGVETLGDSRSILVDGPREQVEAILKVIDQIDSFSSAEQPAVRIVRLEHADSESLAKTLTKVFEAEQAARSAQATPRGTVTAVPIAQPNAVLLVAPEGDMDAVIRLARQLDRQSGDVNQQFELFPLKHAPVLRVQTKLLEFFALRDDQANMRTRVEVVADERTNTLILFAGPEDVATASKLIDQLDSDQNQAVNDLRIFRLRNAAAIELVEVLRQAIASQVTTGTTTTTTTAARPTTGTTAATSANLTTTKTAKLRLVTTDANGKPMATGLLEDVTLTADQRTNSLVVTASPESMGLMAALIESFDTLPGPAAELKVFALRNSDASAMLQTLQAVFLRQSTTSTATAPGATATSSPQPVTFKVGNEENPISQIPLSFAVDVRTNSVLVSGTPGDLLAVEAVILKLDSDNARERQIVVYKLKNLTSPEAAAAIQQFLDAQSPSGTGTSTLPTGTSGSLTTQDQIRNEVSVVAEPISNSLLISSTPRFLSQILKIVEEIDTRPPQVVIQVLIARIRLQDNEEFGVEIGGQNSILFDRSLQVSNALPGAAENAFSPGYNFNTTQALQSPVGVKPGPVGIQALGNLALGRASPFLPTLGGLIFAVSNENLSVLLRALSVQQRLDVLTRPQIMTLDNQAARIFVGQDIPIIQNSQLTQFGSTINSFTYRQVGISLDVTPKISPDGTVLMRVLPQISSRAIGQDQAIATDATGATVATTPTFDLTFAETTVVAHDGETIVLGGLIQKESNFEVRRLPWLGDLPLVGWAFRTEFEQCVKTELIIVLTPHIVYNEADAQRIKECEAARIDWIQKDVECTFGKMGLPPQGTVDCGDCVDGDGDCNSCSKPAGPTGGGAGYQGEYPTYRTGPSVFSESTTGNSADALRSKMIIKPSIEPYFDGPSINPSHQWSDPNLPLPAAPTPPPRSEATGEDDHLIPTASNTRVTTTPEGKQEIFVAINNLEFEQAGNGAAAKKTAPREDAKPRETESKMGLSTRTASDPTPAVRLKRPWEYFSPIVRNKQAKKKGN